MALHKTSDTEPGNTWQKPCIYSCIKKHKQTLIGVTKQKSADWSDKRTIY